LSPAAFGKLPHLVAPAVRDAVHATGGPPDADGWVTATIPIESVRHAVVDLLKLGADVEVLEPSELRAAITETIRDIVALYRRQPG